MNRASVASGRAFRQRYGRWALITGASSGIGEGFARALAARGMDLVIVARRAELLEKIARELHVAYGTSVRPIVMDLARDTAAAELAAAVADLEVGLLVNNAGTGWIGRFDLQAPEEHAKLVRLHCTLPVELTARLLGPMKERSCGAIVLVASVGGYLPMPYYAVYGGTKAFLVSWGEAIAAELRPRGIDVLVLSPGDTKTGFQAVAGEMSTRWSSVEEVVTAGLEALGRRVTVVPGLENKAALLLARFLPRSLIVKMVERRQREQTPKERR